MQENQIKEKEKCYKEKKEIKFLFGQDANLVATLN